VATHGAGDRVVRADMDGPVVGEEGVGDPVEPGTGIAVEEGDGLIGDVAAGEDERLGQSKGEQVVQGRVRQHHA